MCIRVGKINWGEWSCSEKAPVLIQNWVYVKLCHSGFTGRASQCMQLETDEHQFIPLT